MFQLSGFYCRVRDPGEDFGNPRILGVLRALAIKAQRQV